MEVREIKTVVGNLNDFIEVPNGIERLRSAVLNLAVRGLLTEQKKSDGTAEDLYKLIQLAKQTVGSGDSQHKPVVPLVEDDIPFEIPKSWKATRLNDVFDVRDGTHDTPKYVDVGFPLVTSKNLSSGKLDISNVKYISEKDYLDINRRSRVDRNDILFAMIGSIGNPVMVDIEPEFSIKNVALIKCFNIELTSPGFLLLYLKFATIDIRAKSSGAVQSFVSLGYLRKYPFMLPPIAEQQRIVKRVDELMGLIDQLEVEKKERDEVRGKMAVSAFYSLGTEHNEFALKHLTKLVKTPSDVDELEKSILSLAVSGKLTKQDPVDGTAEDLYIEIQKAKEKSETSNKKSKPLTVITEEEAPFDIPNNWKWTKLGDISTKITDGTHHTPKYQDTGVDFISIKNISGGKLSFENTKKISQEEHEEINKRCNPEVGDILFCRIGTLGSSVLVDTKVPFSIFVSVGLIKYSHKLIAPEYLLMVMNSPFMYKQFDAVKAGGLHTNKLNLKSMPDLTVPLPPLAEQKRIVAKVNELMELVQKLRDVIKK